ncbi:MAG TPA: DEAD/DEAH box helicase [Vicinamibacterales bacterium]|nr:DEAD/DEAH box helicase [Vicinamibacterales bacterium]
MPTSARDNSDLSAFAALGLADALVKAVASLGYEEPTPVQRETIPVILSGSDLLAQAATGTGKTAAFALPMIHRLSDDADAGAGKKGGRRRTRGLVLVPTRELAMQVAEATHKYARGSGLSVVPVYGGAPMMQQIRALDRGADIVVGTPGRVLDHIRRNSLTLDAVRVLVLDEADEMLDMGFAEDIDTILEATPKERQTALFSATMPPRLRTIAERHLDSPKRIMIAREKTAAGKIPRVRQVAYVVPRAHKTAALQRVLDMESPTSALVFCRTRLEVDTLVETLNAHGYRAEAIHGGMVQRQREAVMARFRSAKADLLIATDVAARGLDIQQLSHVFNYDVPSAPDAYIHRIGRTGRAGREGVAITLAEPRESRLLRSIEAATKQKIEMATVPTVADLRAKRLELTLASIREKIVEGNLDDVRVVVQTLATEFDLADVAAAAVKLVHAQRSAGEEADERDLPVASSRDERPRGPARESRFNRDDRPSRDERPGSEDRPSRGAGAVRPKAEGTTRIFIGAGREAGIRPADLVGAITNEAGISSRDVGIVQIADRFSVVEVPAAAAEEVIEAMRKTSLRGQRVSVRRDRDD